MTEEKTTRELIEEIKEDIENKQLQLEHLRRKLDAEAWQISWLKPGVYLRIRDFIVAHTTAYVKVESFKRDDTGEYIDINGPVMTEVLGMKYHRISFEMMPFCTIRISQRDNISEMTYIEWCKKVERFKKKIDECYGTPF